VKKQMVASTSGCFDILHAGHAYLFSQMRQAVGDSGLVIVLVNADSYLQRTKGRVIVPLEHRMRLLQAMRDVDVVLPLANNNPCQMIQTLQPDYWYKGPEYTDKFMAERVDVEAYGGVVVCLAEGPDIHTSDIITRVKAPSETVYLGYPYI
jgi:rfaE bifunctional protein nucleotidyltransferase chain/domain